MTVGLGPPHWPVLCHWYLRLSRCLGDDEIHPVLPGEYDTVDALTASIRLSPNIAGVMVGQPVDSLFIDQAVVVVPAGGRLGIAEDLDGEAGDAMQLHELSSVGSSSHWAKSPRLKSLPFSV